MKTLRIQLAALAASFGFEDSEQEPFTGKSGLYCWRDVEEDDDIKKAIEFVAEQLRIPLDPEHLHVTVMYSMESVRDPKEIKLDDQPVEGKITGLDAWQGHDDQWYLVLAVECYELTEKHSQLKDLGAVPTFPTYKPHVTLKEGIDPAMITKERVEAASRALGAFNYRIKFSGEKLADIRNHAEKVDKNKEKETATAAAPRRLTLDPKSVMAFVKAVAVGFASSHYEVPLTPDERKFYATNLKNSKPFLDALGIEPEYYDECIKALRAKSDSDMLWPLWDLGYAVKANYAKVKTALGLSPFELGALEKSYRYTTASDDVPEYLNKWFVDKHPTIAEPVITKLFSKGREAAGEGQTATGDMATTYSRLKDIVSQLKGKYYPDIITFNEQAAIRKDGTAADKALLSEYFAENKKITDAFLEVVRELVASSGENLVDVDDVRDELKAQGVPIRNIPDGYEGKVDALGNLYTNDGVKLKQRPTCPEVRMNPNYTGDNTRAYCFGSFPDAFSARTGKRVDTSYQTVSQVGIRNANKSDKVEHALGVLPKMRNSWRAMMKGRDPREKVMGCILEFMYVSAPRVGTENTVNKSGNSYGTTTFLVKHVTVSGGMIHIKFPAKSSGTGYYQFSLQQTDPWLKLLVAEMQRLADPKRNPNDMFWRANKDSEPISAVELRGWLKKYGLTPKDFRTLKGTMMAVDLLSNLPASIKKVPVQGKKTDREFLKEFNTYTANVTTFFNECMLQIGDALGHFTSKKGEAVVTGNTAIKSYVDHATIRDFFDKRKIKIPATILGKMDAKDV